MLNSKEKNEACGKMGGNIHRHSGCKPTIFVVLLALLYVVFGQGVAQADNLSLLDWTISGNPILTYDATQIEVVPATDKATGMIRLKAVDQSDTAANSGFSKGGVSSGNVVWDNNSQFLTAKSMDGLTLPDNKAPSAWADMTGNVLLYHFDTQPNASGLGFSFPDSSGANVSVTCTGIPMVVNALSPDSTCPKITNDGKINTALTFDGVSNGLFMPGTWGGADWTSVSVETWIKVNGPNSHPGNLQGIITSEDLKFMHFQTYLPNVANTLVVYFNNGLAAPLPAPSSTPYGQWRHLAIVAKAGDGINPGFFTLYENGVQKSTVAVDKTWTSIAPSTKVWIGKGYYSDASPRRLNGALDELAIYKNHVFTAKEIQDHYNHQAAKYTNTFDSKIFSAGPGATWNSLSWVQTMLNGVQLPDARIKNLGNGLGSVDMKDNILLLHMNDANGAPTPFTESSGKTPTAIGQCYSYSSPTANAGVLNGPGCLAPTFLGQPGLFDKSLMFDGSQSIQSPDSTQLKVSNSISLEAWVYPTAMAIPSDGSFVIAKGAYAVNPLFDYELALVQPQTAPTITATPDIVTSYNEAYFRLNNSATSFIRGGSVPINTWSHLVATYDKPTSVMSLYVNGVLVGSKKIAVPTPTTGVFVIGESPYSTALSHDSHFRGKIDEVAVYSSVGSALSASDVQNRYLRGALMPKFQVQACQKADCSDKKEASSGLPIFVGPDSSSNSYFVPSALTQSGSQLVDFSTLSLSGQYFQYRVTLDSSLSGLYPAIKQVAVGPDHFLMNSPSVVVNTEQDLSQIVSTSFADTVTTSGSGNDVRYQLSMDGQKWWFCNVTNNSGSKWHDTQDALYNGYTDLQKSNNASDIKKCLNLVSASGSGQIWFKAFLHSKTGDQVSLSEVKTNFIQPVVVVPPPVEPTTFELGGTLTENVSEGSLLDFKVDLSTVKDDVPSPYKGAVCDKCPQGMTVSVDDDAKTVEVKWTPAYKTEGTYAGTVVVTGSNDKTAVQPLSIKVVHADAVPKFTSVPSEIQTTVTAGQKMAFNVVAEIANGNKPNYSITSNSKKDGMAIDANGLFTWTPAANVSGNFAMTIRATDSSTNVYADQSLTLTVDAPGSVAQAAAITLNVDEGSELTFNLPKIDPAKVYAFSCTNNCPQGLSVNNTTGAVTWKPSYKQAGNYSVQFLISGDTPATNWIQPIVVNDVSSLPQIQSIGDKTVVAGQNLSFTVAASDADGGASHFEIASPKQDGMALDTSSGAFNWATKATQVGSYVVVIHALDSQDPNKFGEQSVVITVTADKSTEVTGSTVPQAAPVSTPVSSGGTQEATAPAAAPAPAAASPTVSGCTLIR